MGTLVDKPNNSNESDDWALVSGTVVINIINANLSFIQTIQNNYDYLVDITTGNNSANCDIGSTYNVDSDTFSAPPIDYIGRLRQDLGSIFAVLSQALADSGGMSVSDIITACNNANNDSSGSFSSNEQSVANIIYSWLQNGG